MKTLLFRLPVFLTLFVLISCYGNADKQGSYVKYKHVDVDTFHFQAQQLPIDIIDAHCILAVDTFLLFHQMHEEKMLQIYSLNSCDSLAGICRKGQGPDEFIHFLPSFFTVYKDGIAKVWVKSIPNMLGLVNINESVKQDKIVFEKKLTFSGSRKMNIFGQSDANFCYEDSVIWMRMNPMFAPNDFVDPNSSFSKYNVRTNSIEKIIKINDVPADPKYNYLSSHTLAYHPSQQKIAAFYNYMGFFNIIDFEQGSVLKVETFENGVNNSYSHENIKEVHFKASATDALIWVINEKNDGTTAMRIYDWNGSLKGIATFDKVLNYFHINLQNNILYAIGLDDEIYKFDICSTLSKLSQRD
ncbi:MAG: hypothetical protein ACRDCN_04145 [Tannerellaceae bacterium]